MCIRDRSIPLKWPHRIIKFFASESELAIGWLNCSPSGDVNIISSYSRSAFKVNAQIEVDIMLVHGIEGIERHGHPAVYVHQVGHLAVAPGAERAALAQRIGPGEPHRVEVHDVPALAFGVHDVERQLRGGDRDQHTVSDPLCGDDPCVPLPTRYFPALPGQ